MSRYLFAALHTIGLDHHEAVRAVTIWSTLRPGRRELLLAGGRTYVISAHGVSRHALTRTSGPLPDVRECDAAVNW